MSSRRHGCHTHTSSSSNRCSTPRTTMPAPPLKIMFVVKSSLRRILFAGSKMKGVTVGGKFFSFGSMEIELNDRKLSEDELLPLLEAFRDRKFLRLYRLKLVILDCVQYDKNTTGCDSCAAEW